MPTCDQCGLDWKAGRPSNGESGLGLCSPCQELANRDPPIHISPLQRSDLELVLAWRSIPEVYRYFRKQTGPLEWEQHVAWFDSRPPNRFDFIIHFGERRVGVVSVDSSNEVTIYLGDFSASGKGVATNVLRWLCERFSDRAPLTAEIHEENDASQRLFQQCGFERTSSDSEWIRYIYGSGSVMSSH